MRGFSLIEMTVVIALVGMAALLALPTFSAARAPRLELAALRLADALRAARSETLRSGQSHGLRIDPQFRSDGGREVTVYRVTTTASPFGRGATLRDPHTGQPLAFDLSGAPGARALTLDTARAPFRCRGLSAGWDLHFLPTGAAVCWQDGSPHLLSEATLVLRDGAVQRTVTVLPVSGRVVVQ